MSSFAICSYRFETAQCNGEAPFLSVNFKLAPFFRSIFTSSSLPESRISKLNFKKERVMKNDEKNDEQNDEKNDEQNYEKNT